MTHFLNFTCAQDDEEIEKPFDPKTGFTIKKLTIPDSDLYKCVVEKDGEILHEVTYALSVHRKYSRFEILIQPCIY